MKIFHKPEFDYLSIQFEDTDEVRSVFENGIIVHYGENDNVVGIDITDSSRFFKHGELLSLKEACQFLGISESTMRRKIREKKIRYSGKDGSSYLFRKSDLSKLA